MLRVIVAVGTSVTYAVLLARAAREPGHLAHVLRSARFLDDRVANPAYVMALLSGPGLVLLGAWPLTTPWIAASLGLFAVLSGLGLGAYTPLLRRHLAAVEAEGPASPRAVALAARGTPLGAAMLGLAAPLVFLMVAKPALA